MVSMVEVASTDAVWWSLFTLFTAAGLLLAGTVTLIFFYLIYKYRYKPGSGADEGREEIKPGRIYVETPARGSSRLLLLFTGIIVMSLIVATFDETIYLERTPVDDAFVVWVTGFQFGWEFEYMVDGQTLRYINYLVLPTDTVVEFKVTSRDVFHTFGFAEFKTKIDAIPGVVNSMWIKTPDEPGVYKAYCYELCGVGHSLMVGEVIIVDKDEFFRAYEAGPEAFKQFVDNVIAEYRRGGLE